ncbi:MAG TPA: hypothetical protein VHA52_01955 [Candidatus Babeliaceae bacterium]|nr:hypothetical protein [Candidatus Babeliaceae bacterium]
MKFSIYTLWGLTVLLLPGCFYNSDQTLLYEAESLYKDVYLRYKTVILDIAEPNIIANARLIGSGSGISLGKAWQSFLAEDYSSKYSKSTPIHRAVNFIERDLEALGRMLELLELRFLKRYAIFKSLEMLYESLLKVVQMIQALPLYTKEEQFIERVELEKERISKKAIRECET